MFSRRIAFGAGLAAFAALATTAAWAEGGKRVAFLDGPIADKYIGGMTRSFTETAKANGLDVSVVQSPFDPALQAQQLDDAIAKKVDAIVMMIMSQKALIPALYARQGGAHSGHTDQHADSARATSTRRSLERTARDGDDCRPKRWLKASRGRTGAKVAIVAGSMDEGIAPARVAAFKKEMENHPGISVVAVEETHWAPPEAERAAGQLLARFSGQGGLDGIYAMNDPLANGVVQGAQSAGVKLGTAKGELVIVGGNCLAMGIADIEQGTMYATLYWTPINMGRDRREYREEAAGRQDRAENANPECRNHHQSQRR